MNTTEVKQLLPCPFCGSAAMITGGGTQGKKGRLPYVIKCSSMICPIGLTSKPIYGKVEAMNAWNSRINYICDK